MGLAGFLARPGMGYMPGSTRDLVSNEQGGELQRTLTPLRWLLWVHGHVYPTTHREIYQKTQDEMSGS